MQVFSLKSYGYDLVAAPYFILITVLMIGIFYSKAVALRYAVIFGFLTDVIYTNVWGVYAFCITLTAYLILLLGMHFNQHLIIVVIVSMLATIMLDLEVYGVYTLIGMANQNFIAYTQQHLSPTLILNTVFAIIVFYPFKKMMGALKDR